MAYFILTTMTTTISTMFSPAWLTPRRHHLERFFLLGSTGKIAQDLFSRDKWRTICWSTDELTSKSSFMCHEKTSLERSSLLNATGRTARGGGGVA
jgi:hypothetical protein